MKYKNLPKYETLLRLVQVSFSKPAKNIMMFRLYNALKNSISLVDLEKNKLLKKYGIDEGDGKYRLVGENYVAYANEWNELIESDIEDEIPAVSFSIEDFDEENCSYPNEKEMWPSGLDISTFLEFCETLKKEMNEKSGG